MNNSNNVSEAAQRLKPQNFDSIFKLFQSDETVAVFVFISMKETRIRALVKKIRRICLRPMDRNSSKRCRLVWKYVHTWEPAWFSIRIRVLGSLLFIYLVIMPFLSCYTFGHWTMYPGSSLQNSSPTTIVLGSLFH